MRKTWWSPCALSNLQNYFIIFCTLFNTGRFTILHSALISQCTTLNITDPFHQRKSFILICIPSKREECEWKQCRSKFIFLMLFISDKIFQFPISSIKTVWVLEWHSFLWLLPRNVLFAFKRQNCVNDFFFPLHLIIAFSYLPLFCFMANFLRINRIILRFIFVFD